MQTEDIREVIERKLRSDKRMAALKAKHLRLMANGKVVQAMQVKKEMADLLEHTTLEYLKQKESERLRLMDVQSQLSPEQLIKFRTRIIVAGWLADILDMCILDIDETMQTIEQGLHIESFDTLQALGNEARHVMSMMKSKSTEHEWLWADTLDSVEAYLFRRAETYNKREAKLSEKLTKQQSKSNNNEKD